MTKILTVLAAILALVGSTAEAQLKDLKERQRPTEQMDDWGRQKLVIPEATERGNWTGTWFYISREFHVALWLNAKDDGLPEIKVRLFRLGGGEQFVTDWAGHSDYDVRSAPGRFDLKLTAGDKNTLDGEWDWSLDFANSSRKELGKLKIYRTGDGRRLVLRFDDFVRTIRRGAIVNEVPLEQVWVLRKASKRIVDWTELPF